MCRQCYRTRKWHLCTHAHTSTHTRTHTHHALLSLIWSDAGQILKTKFVLGFGISVDYIALSIYEHRELQRRSEQMPHLRHHARAQIRSTCIPHWTLQQICGEYADHSKSEHHSFTRRQRAVGLGLTTFAGAEYAVNKRKPFFPKTAANVHRTRSLLCSNLYGFNGIRILPLHTESVW